MPPTLPPTKTAPRAALIAGSVLLIALLARLLPWDQVFVAGKVYFFDPDSYVRLRKILVYLTSFPKTAVYDYYQGFPQGTGVLTPPTMEYLLAAGVYPFQNAAGLLPALQTGLALIPPLIGAVTALAVCRFSSVRFGLLAGLAAGLVLALAPAHLEATLLGRFDNEMLEPLLLLAACGAYLQTYPDPARRAPWLWCSAASLAYLSIWRGGITLLAIIGLDLCWRIVSSTDQDRDTSLTIGKRAALMYGLGAGVMATVCVTDLWGTRQTFSYNIISWFQVTLFAGAGLTLLAMAWGRQRSRIAGLLAGLGATSILIALLAGNLAEGFQVIGGGNPWLDSINQYQHLSPGRLLATCGGSLLLLPIGLWLLLRPNRQPHPERRFLVLWTLVVLLAALLRQRFVEYLPLNLAILASVVTAQLAPKLRLPPIGQVLAVAGAILLLQAPSYATLTSFTRLAAADPYRGDLEETLTWLRHNSPSPGDPLRPENKPAYGVMARWDYGGWIESVGQRPTVATSYGTETYGMQAVAAFFMARTEAEMIPVLRQNQVRYIIADNMTTSLPMYAKLINNPAQLVEEVTDPRSGTVQYAPAPALFELIISRLFYADGTDAQVDDMHFRPVEGLRLLFESASPAEVSGLPWDVRKIKLFEFGTSATIIAHARPGQQITLTQPVETNRQRRFVYRISKPAGPDGSAHFQVVYPPKQQPERTGSCGPLTIASGSRVSTLTISDTDIQTGRQLHVTP